MDRSEIVPKALEIAEEYREQDLTLTLRQIYYQFVARGLAPSGDSSYRRIGEALTEARYEGDFPVELIVDRGRSVKPGAFTRDDRSVDRAAVGARDWVRALPEFLMQVDRWTGQASHVSVWFEKEALSGVFGPVCDELGVSWFACKGYPSVSSLFEWVRSAAFACGCEQEDRRYRYPGVPVDVRERHEGRCERCEILYLGDHDPDGWEIPRSAIRNVARICDVEGIALDVSWDRLALNMDQIRRYNPPPFEAKVSSSRYASYVREHETDDAWELDALEPTVLRDLIRSEIEDRFDPDVHEGNRGALQIRRSALRNRMLEPAWIAETFGGAK